MKFDERNGIKRSNVIALACQMLLVTLGFINSWICFIFTTLNNGTFQVLLLQALCLVAYTSIIIYALYGFKKKKAYYFAAIFSFALLCLLAPMYDGLATWMTILMSLMSVLTVAFFCNLKKRKIAIVLIGLAVVIAMVLAIYGTVMGKDLVIEDPNQEFIRKVIYYSSCWSPTLISGAICTTYAVRAFKVKEETK